MNALELLVKFIFNYNYRIDKFEFTDQELMYLKEMDNSQYEYNHEDELFWSNTSNSSELDNFKIKMTEKISKGIFRFSLEYADNIDQKKLFSLYRDSHLSSVFFAESAYNVQFSTATRALDEAMNMGESLIAAEMARKLGLHYLSIYGDHAKGNQYLDITQAQILRCQEESKAGQYLAEISNLIKLEGASQNVIQLANKYLTELKELLHTEQSNYFKVYYYALAAKYQIMIGHKDSASEICMNAIKDIELNCSNLTELDLIKEYFSQMQ